MSVKELQLEGTEPISLLSLRLNDNKSYKHICSFQANLEIVTRVHAHKRQMWFLLYHMQTGKVSFVFWGVEPMPMTANNGAPSFQCAS